MYPIPKVHWNHEFLTYIIIIKGCYWKIKSVNKDLPLISNRIQSMHEIIIVDLRSFLKIIYDIGTKILYETCFATKMLLLFCKSMIPVRFCTVLPLHSCAGTKTRFKAFSKSYIFRFAGGAFMDLKCVFNDSEMLFNDFEMFCLWFWKAV